MIENSFFPEEIEGEAVSEGNAVDVVLKPYEIVTVLLR